MSHADLKKIVDNSYDGFDCVIVLARVWGIFNFSDVPLDVPSLY